MWQLQERFVEMADGSRTLALSAKVRDPPVRTLALSDVRCVLAMCTMRVPADCCFSYMPLLHGIILILQKKRFLYLKMQKRLH